MSPGCSESLVTAICKLSAACEAASCSSTIVWIRPLGSPPARIRSCFASSTSSWSSSCCALATSNWSSSESFLSPLAFSSAAVSCSTCALLVSSALSAFCKRVSTSFALALKTGGFSSASRTAAAKARSISRSASLSASTAKGCSSALVCICTRRCAVSRGV